MKGALYHSECFSFFLLFYFIIFFPPLQLNSRSCIICCHCSQGEAVDVTAGACRGEPGSPRGWGEAAGQPALGAVPGPLRGRLLGGVWGELGCPAQAGLAQREQSCWRDAPRAREAQFPSRTGDAHIPSARARRGFAAGNFVGGGTGQKTQNI